MAASASNNSRAEAATVPVRRHQQCPADRAHRTTISTAAVECPKAMPAVAPPRQRRYAVLPLGTTARNEMEPTESKARPRQRQQQRRARPGGTG
eukprot:gene9584-5385_t